ncbi:MAG: hypothetical protein V1745_00450 [Patescibacteria group bacterium]
MPITALNQPQRWQEVRMYLPITLTDGTPTTIIVRYRTTERLAKTCFRGTDRTRAGNFFRFTRVDDIFKEGEVLAALRKHVLECIDELIETPGAPDATYSSTVDVGHTVGWESTSDLASFSEESLERFNPNRRSHALRVKPTRTDVRAPRTSLITFVYQLKREGDGWAVIIHSLYPGRDIGELKGNITQRERRVFFTWEHPGA